MTVHEVDAALGVAVVAFVRIPSTRVSGQLHMH